MLPSVKRGKSKGWVNYFDVRGVLKKMAEKIDILPQEVTAIERRLNALATATRPPNWGYAGMLAELVADKDIKDVFDVYATVKEWRDNPALANTQFDSWNAARLAKS